jgi:hypothetical protein
MENATSMIALVRKTKSTTSHKNSIKILESHQIRAFPSFTDLELTAGFKGRKVEPTNIIEIEVPRGSKRCNLIFWSHSWSGVARIYAANQIEEVDLYSHVGGCRRVQIVPTTDRIVIEPLTSKREESLGHQVILFRAVFST